VIVVDAFAVAPILTGESKATPRREHLKCCAQAKVGGASFLHKGEDFSQTDIESAA
jgi:uncharacterized protein with PIN domain